MGHHPVWFFYGFFRTCEVVGQRLPCLPWREFEGEVSGEKRGYKSAKKMDIMALYCLIWFFLCGFIWVVYGLSGIISWDINEKSCINRVYNTIIYIILLYMEYKWDMNLMILMRYTLRCPQTWQWKLPFKSGALIGKISK